MQRSIWLIGLCAALTVGSARADCGPTGCVGYVDQLYVESNGDLYLQTSGIETQANCVPNSGAYLFLAGNATKFKETYAMLLTAQAMGWQVRIRVVEGSNPCAIAWTAVDRQ